MIVPTAHLDDSLPSERLVYVSHLGSCEMATHKKQRQMEVA